MLIWNKELWLIDHGAALYFHHTWTNWQEHAIRPFVQVKDHVLLPFAAELPAADEEMRASITAGTITGIVNLIPDDWLNSDTAETPEQMREVYASFLAKRLEHSQLFLNEAQHARTAII
jgi:hypothetical protein